MNSMLDEKKNYEISGEKRRITLFNISSCEKRALNSGRNLEECRKSSTFASSFRNNGLVQNFHDFQINITSVTKN